MSTYRDDIVGLAKELDRMKANSTDIVASAKDIHAVEFPEPTDVNRNRLELAVEDYDHYPLSHWGSLQLADKCGIPRKYYEAMLAAGMVELTAENVNAWLSKQGDRRLVRIADGRIRAVLSDRYRVLDNYDLAFLTMERAKQHNAQVQRCDLTETRMYVKLVVPGYAEYLNEQGKAQPQSGHVKLSDLNLDKDPHVPGLIISNSEVGDGAFRVEPFVFRLVCSNGLIGESSLYKVHLGQRMEIGELVFRDDTRKALDEALWKQVRDIIDGTFNGEILHQFMNKLRTANTIEIRKPQEVIDATAKNLGLSEERKLDLLRYFAKEGDTVFGLINGITRLAQDVEDYDEQIRMERYAGEVLELKVPTIIPPQRA